MSIKIVLASLPRSATVAQALGWRARRRGISGLAIQLAGPLSSHKINLFLKFGIPKKLRTSFIYGGKKFGHKKAVEDGSGGRQWRTAVEDGRAAIGRVCECLTRGDGGSRPLAADNK